VPQVNLSSDGDFVAGHPKKAAAAQRRTPTSDTSTTSAS